MRLHLSYNLPFEWHRMEHHMCEEPECEGTLIAFATPEELGAHRRSVHARGMPRFDRARARPLSLHSELLSNVLLVDLPNGPQRGRGGARCAEFYYSPMPNS